MTMRFEHILVAQNLFTLIVEELLGSLQAHEQQQLNQKTAEKSFEKAFQS